jgi:NAD(P)-dependent dehydrogenase (short-subunit alcohol dehydrogenase family)
VLDGTRAVVTAAGSGIGHSIATAFADQGATVVICDSDAQAVRRATAADARLTGVVADVADSRDVESLFLDVVSELQGLDVLVNNVGIAGPTGLIEDTLPTEWNKTMQVNVGSHFYCARKAIPLLKAQRSGAILNISSVAGQFGYPFHVAYAVSKAAVIAFTNTLAMELGAYGVRANAICPCAVEGPRIDAVIEADARTRGMPVDAVRSAYLRQNSMNTFIDASDVAALAVYLASPAGARVSGQAIAIDGNTETLRP